MRRNEKRDRKENGAKSPSSLNQLQGWMQTVITHPGGLAPGMAAASELLPVADLETMVQPSATLTSAERLAIYGRAYRARLFECFRAEFPCLLHACGDDLFGRFVHAYLDRYPPQSYTLNLLAKCFPRFLAETRPQAEIPAEERESWPDFLIDLATLERAFSEVYDGPGVEGLELPNPSIFESMKDRQLERLRFAPAPSLRLFTFRYPVDTYFTAARRGQNPPLPAPESRQILLYRKTYMIRLRALTRAEAMFLSVLVTGTSVGEGLCEVREATGQPLCLNKVRSKLAEWTSWACFQSIIAPANGEG